VKEGCLVNGSITHSRGDAAMIVQALRRAIRQIDRDDDSRSEHKGG
jgi:hypothetical protein